MARKSLPRKYAARGNALVEMALIFIPLLSMFFAFVDFGMVIFIRSTLQSAVRAGVRYAITYQTAPGFGQDDSIRQIVQQNAAGVLDGASGAALISVKYYVPPDLTNPVNGPGSNGPANVVEVSVQNYQWGWIAPLSGVFSQPFYANTPLGITVYSSDRMEGLPGGQATPPNR